MAADVSAAPGQPGGRGRKFPPWFWWALAGGGGAIVLLVLAMRGSGGSTPAAATTQSDQGGSSATDISNLVQQDISQSQQLAAGISSAAQAETGLEAQLQQQLSAFQQQFASTLPLGATTRGAMDQFQGTDFASAVPIRQGTSGLSSVLRTIGLNQPIQLAGPPVAGQSNFAGATGPGGVPGSTWWYPVVGGGFISAFDLGQITSARQAALQPAGQAGA